LHSARMAQQHGAASLYPSVGFIASIGENAA
jgi:hypothetical protein